MSHGLSSTTIATDHWRGASGASFTFHIHWNTFNVIFDYYHFIFNVNISGYFFHFILTHSLLRYKRLVYWKCTLSTYNIRLYPTNSLKIQFRHALTWSRECLPCRYQDSRKYIMQETGDCVWIVLQICMSYF